MAKIVDGCVTFWKMNIIHRDIKLANILLHFPNNPEVATMNKDQKDNFLKAFDFSKGVFNAVISDFGMSTIVQ